MSRCCDRKSECQAHLESIAIALREGGEWVLIHRCRGCTVLHENRIAGDDSIVVLMPLAARPLAQPPLPLDFLPSSRASRVTPQGGARGALPPPTLESSHDLRETHSTGVAAQTTRSRSTR
ncbi:MAG: RNHCP domain-containing protein [Dehalococcoidia bacterium]|nr:RNHCP domain-containing protein [Dehalococcoidia bacterium]